MTSVSLQQLDNGDVYTSNGTTGNNTSTGTINVTGCDSAEQITKLFPKCRPRADVNLNPLVVVRSTSSSNNEHDDMNTSPPTMLSPDTPEPLISIQDLNEADRVIEIAGGREIYSQSRTKAARKSRYIGDYADKKKGVWDVRTRCSDSLKHNNPREVTETVFSTEVCSVRHQRPNVHSNNVYTKANSVIPTTEATVVSPSRNVTVVSCGEVVVFDDIGDNWQGLRLDLCQDNNKQQQQTQQQQTSQQIVKLPSSESNDRGTEHSSREDSPNEVSQYHRTTTDFFKIVTSVSDFDADSLSPEPNNKVAQMIGNLPIAVYEGSPRRYGPRQPETNTQSNHPALPSAHSLLASPSVYPPRPGFPQRVVTTPSENEPQQMNSPTSDVDNTVHPVNSTFDYLYEFSETRKVLEEFFKCPPENENSLLEETSFQDLDYELHRQGGSGDSGSSYVGQRLAKVRADQNEYLSHMDSPRKPNVSDFPRIQDHEVLEHENNFLDLSVGTGSSGDLGETEVGLQVGHSRNFTLSPETTDCDSNCGDLDSEMSLMLMENELGPSAVGLLGSSGDLVAPTDSLRLYSSMPVLEDGLSSGHASDTDNNNPTVILMKRQITEIEREIIQRSHLNDNNLSSTSKLIENNSKENGSLDRSSPVEILIGNETSVNSFQENETELHNIDPLVSEVTPPPPAPAPHRRPSDVAITEIEESPPDRVEAAIQDIRLALQRTKTLPFTLTNVAPQVSPTEQDSSSPVWVPRQRGMSGASRDSDSVERKAQSGEEAGDEEEADTDLETDRLLGQHRTDDQGFYDDKLDKENKKKGRNKEGLHEPSVLIEGVLFRARYLGSTQLVCEGQPTKSTRMMQAEEAVSRIKAPDGESQPSTEVDLFISTEKIMVLNTDLKEIMMDHALRTISYIADIGDLVVLMARRRLVPHEMEDPPKINRTPKMICHVFESEEAQFIAQSIGQAFQVAYMEFLKANGIEDHSFVKEMDYQEVLNSQEIFGDELQMFAKKEMQKEVVVPKSKGEILGVVIVESGWGSMLPTVVIANLAPAGAAARCGQLNIGDQIIAINGVSLVGLPLSTCQNYIKNSKNQTVVKLTVVPCAPVVEVKIKRPDTKYQLGFSVQNGVICSLLRGGIAERGGVRVGHRIIEINNQSVVAVPHEKIVNLLATSVGEILMKTMPTSMFRLLTGQENPVYI